MARGRLFTSICLAVAVLGSLSALLSFGVNYAVSPYLAVGAVCAVALFAVFPALTCLTGSISGWAHVVLLALYAHICTLGLFANQTHGQALNYLVAIPVLTSLLIGYRSGLVAGAIVAATYLIFMQNPMPYWTGLTLCILTIGLTLATSVFQSEVERMTLFLLEARKQADRGFAEVWDAKMAVEHEAMHDSLTGLPNRRYLKAILEETKHKPGGGDGWLGIAHIDLDRFKEVNDTFGHAAGDFVLKHCADVLRSVLREDDFVSRIGGDEFVLVSMEEGKRSLEARARRMIEHLQQPIPFEDKVCHVGASVGICLSDDETSDPHRLLQNADLALYKAKDSGRGQCVIFDQALKAEKDLKKKTAEDILRGLENGDFVPAYQPQFSAVTFDLMGVEVLARWQHPDRGLLAPGAFLATAEDLGVVADIDAMIMNHALRDHEVLMSRGVHIPQISVNVSAGRLEDPSLLDQLPNLSRINHDLAFELLETVFLDRVSDVVKRNLDGLRSRGIRLEIDDFGSGHASFTSLMLVKPHRLKIDRALVDGLESDLNKRSIVQAIIEIGHTLHVEVLAEGVETTEQARILGALGCDTLQGFGLCGVLCLKELESFVRDESWRKIA